MHVVFQIVISFNSLHLKHLCAVLVSKSCFFHVSYIAMTVIKLLTNVYFNIFSLIRRLATRYILLNRFEHLHSIFYVVSFKKNSKRTIQIAS